VDDSISRFHVDAEETFCDSTKSIAGLACCTQDVATEKVTFIQLPGKLRKAIG